MKYYIIKDKERSGYLSRTLCRINSKGKFEIYNWTHGARWEPNERVEDIFNSKDKNYDIYVPKKKEIEDVKWEVEDSAYEYSHTHVYEPVDDKGNQHSEFIYQDYRSLDGYDAETGFNYSEIWHRNEFDYYFDKENGFLIKKEKDSEKYYVLRVELDFTHFLGKKIEWLEPKDFKKEVQKLINNYDFNKLEKITDFQRVLDYFETMWMSYKDYLALWEKKD